MKADNHTFHVLFPLPYYSYIYNVTRYQHRDKNDLVIDPCNCISFCTYISYFNFFKYGQLLLPSHFLRL